MRADLFHSGMAIFETRFSVDAFALSAASSNNGGEDPSHSEVIEQKEKVRTLSKFLHEVAVPALV